MNSQIRDKEKRILIFFAKEAIFGIFSPLSIVTELNLDRAVESLHNGKFDMLYLSLEHTRLIKALSAKHYILEKFIPSKLHHRVYISTGCGRPFADQFALFLTCEHDLKMAYLHAMEANLFFHDVVKRQILNAVDSEKRNGNSVPILHFV